MSDKSRIIGSAPFRRLHGKAQVFSLAHGGDVRTRLTHSLEVSNYGELIATRLAEKLAQRGDLNEELRLLFVQNVENACLLHDIGNPPFGHMGENAIAGWFRLHHKELATSWITTSPDLSPAEANRYLKAYEAFDGNPQGFRIISRLQWLADPFGMNLTCPLLAAYIKYLGEAPVEKSRFFKKVGYFPSEAETVAKVWTALGLRQGTSGPLQRHPLAFVMEAADDIAFCLSDIEDALERRLVTETAFIEAMKAHGSPHIGAAVDKDKTSPTPLLRRGVYHFYRLAMSADLVQRAVDSYIDRQDSILDGSVTEGLLQGDPQARSELDAVRQFCVKNIYTSREVLESEIGGLSALTGILDAFRPMLEMTQEDFTRLGDVDDGDRLRRNPMEALLFSRLPPTQLQAYRWASSADASREPIYRAQLVTDYVSGMTDGHTLKVYNMINGTQPSTID